MKANELRRLLHEGERTVLGTCVVSPSTKWPGLVASCGLDFVFIDTEHIALNRETVSWTVSYTHLTLPTKA